MFSPTLDPKNVSGRRWLSCNRVEGNKHLQSGDTTGNCWYLCESEVGNNYKFMMCNLYRQCWLVMKLDFKHFSCQIRSNERNNGYILSSEPDTYFSTHTCTIFKSKLKIAEIILYLYRDCRIVAIKHNSLNSLYDCKNNILFQLPPPCLHHTAPFNFSRYPNPIFQNMCNGEDTDEIYQNNFWDLCSARVMAAFSS